MVVRGLFPDSPAEELPYANWLLNLFFILCLYGPELFQLNIILVAFGLLILLLTIVRLSGGNFVLVVHF